MIKPCIGRCVRTYGRDLDIKAITIVVGCALAAAVAWDIGGSAFLVCLALGGVSDVTAGLSACILKCIRGRHDDR